MESIPETFQMIRRRHFKLEYKHNVYDIVCPEYTSPAKDIVLVIPDYLIPRRKYPLYIYLYAINLYCSNSNMGQREAARLTRRKFDLATFSHTTLGRALIALGASIAKAKKIPIEQIKEQPSPYRFPTVNDTAILRKLIASFLRKYDVSDEEIINASSMIMAHWYDKYRRLII